MGFFDAQCSVYNGNLEVTVLQVFPFSSVILILIVFILGLETHTCRDTLNVCMYISIQTHTKMQIKTRACTHTHTHANAYRYTYIQQTHAHIHTHTHTRIPSRPSISRYITRYTCATLHITQYTCGTYSNASLHFTTHDTIHMTRYT